MVQHYAQSLSSPHISYTAYPEPETYTIVPVTDGTRAATAYIEDATSHIECATSYIEDMNSTRILPIVPARNYAEVTTAHTAPATVPTEAENSHTEAVTSHVVNVNAHAHPFEPTATAYEKMAKLFLFERVQTLGPT